MRPADEQNGCFYGKEAEANCSTCVLLALLAFWAGTLKSAAVVAKAALRALLRESLSGEVIELTFSLDPGSGHIPGLLAAGSRGFKVFLRDEILVLTEFAELSLAERRLWPVGRCGAPRAL